MSRTVFRLSHALRAALVLTTAGFLGTVSLAERASAQQNQENQNRGQQSQSLDNVEIHVLPVQGNVYMLVGAGGNITLQVGDEGVLLVDTQFAELSDKVLAAIRKLSNKPIRYIINTHVHPDHTGGNENIAKAGSTIAGGNVVGTIGASAGQGATVIAHENVLNRMSAPTGQQAPMPIGAWPTDTFFTLEKEVFFNGEAIQILHQPAAHTDGDTIVFFRRSDVVSTGDIFVTTSYPVIDTLRGGSIQGIVDALNRILDVTIPREKQEGGITSSHFKRESDGSKWNPTPCETTRPAK